MICSPTVPLKCAKMLRCLVKIIFTFNALDVCLEISSQHIELIYFEKEFLATLTCHSVKKEILSFGDGEKREEDEKQ